jgi:diacylglycerol kinase (ATP)
VSLRITLVVNPASNRGAAAGIGRDVAALLAADPSRPDVRVRSGSDAAESARLLAQAAEDSDAVLVCGGDGIAHLAVNALACGDVPLGIIPAGSGNDTASALGAPSAPGDAASALLEALRTGSVRRIDLGHCPNAPAVSPRARGRWWVSMLYGGFDSAVNERANRMRWPRGPRRYDLAIMGELAALRQRPFRITLDGEVLELSATLVAVGNGPRYGGGKAMTPGALMDDGIFEVTVVGAVSRLTLARLAPKLPRAGHIGHPAVSQYRAVEVSLDAADTVGYADGERVAPLPLATRCVAAALPVLVPPGAAAPGLSRS